MREKDRWGDKLLYFDGLTIRLKDQWGEKLFYLDGLTLRLENQWGEKLLYFETIPDRWILAVVAVLLLGD